MGDSDDPILRPWLRDLRRDLVDRLLDAQVWRPPAANRLAFRV